MSSVDLTSLLSAVSDAAPAGPNLEDDASFAELAAGSRGKPEQQFGETVIPGEEPDWRQVKGLALGLLGKTRDLRVGVTLTRALIRTDGIEGIADGLSLINGWLEGMWDAVHPQLDPSATRRKRACDPGAGPLDENARRRCDRQVECLTGAQHPRLECQLARPRKPVQRSLHFLTSQSPLGSG
jgi:predicted component of type VI protein secretion system